MTRGSLSRLDFYFDLDFDLDLNLNLNLDFESVDTFVNKNQSGNARSLNIPSEHTVQRAINRWTTVACTPA
jgi:hypothetical protein